MFEGSRQKTLRGLNATASKTPFHRTLEEAIRPHRCSNTYTVLR